MLHKAMLISVDTQPKLEGTQDGRSVNYLHKELYLRCCMGPRFPSTYDVPSVFDVFRMRSIKAVCSLGLIVRLTIRHQLVLEF